MTHASIPADERHRNGLKDTLIRLSIGIEDANDLIQEHGATVWLVNTGWTGGGFGMGQRINLSYTRALIRAVLTGTLSASPFNTHPIFDLAMPATCPDVPDSILDPRQTWSDPTVYDAKANRLKDLRSEKRRSVTPTSLSV